MYFFLVFKSREEIQGKSRGEKERGFLRGNKNAERGNR